MSAYLISDPLDALFLKRRFGARVLVTYFSGARGKEVTIDADERWLLEMLSGRCFEATRIQVDKSSLDRLDGRQVAGLKYFNILPQEMAVL